jgi:chromosome segregation ATPase
MLFMININYSGSIPPSFSSAPVAPDRGTPELTSSSALPRGLGYPSFSYGLGAGASSTPMSSSSLRGRVMAESSSPGHESIEEPGTQPPSKRRTTDTQPDPLKKQHNFYEHMRRGAIRDQFQELQRVLGLKKTGVREVTRITILRKAIGKIVDLETRIKNLERQGIAGPDSGQSHHARVHQLEDEVIVLRSRYEAEKVDKNLLRERLLKSQADRDAEASRVDGLTDDLATANQISSSLHADIAQLRRLYLEQSQQMLQQSAAFNRSHNPRVQELEAGMAVLRSQCETDKSRFENECSMLRAGLHTATLRVDELSGNLATANQANSSLNSEIARLREAYLEQSQQIFQQPVDIDGSHNQRVQELEAEMAELRFSYVADKRRLEDELLMAQADCSAAKEWGRNMIADLTAKHREEMDQLKAQLFRGPHS